MPALDQQQPLGHDTLHADAVLGKTRPVQRTPGLRTSVGCTPDGLKDAPHLGRRFLDGGRQRSSFPVGQLVDLGLRPDHPS
ncbi:MAG: hypothetical protein Q7V53_03575 [Caldisericota bacterium]|nr:hypothetical protein [Caldisericota bacterium]